MTLSPQDIAPRTPIRLWQILRRVAAQWSGCGASVPDDGVIA